MMRVHLTVTSVVYALGICLGLGQAEEARDVCQAKTLSAGKSIRIRGTARFGPDGLVIGDATCPIGHSDDLKIPAMVLVQVSSFASREQEVTYVRERKRASNGDPIVQILTEGDLRCRDISFKRSDTGQIIGGDGFGEQGLIACQLSGAKVIAFQWIVDGVVPPPLLPAK